MDGMANMWLSIVLIIIGMAILVLGGELLLRGAVGLATLLKMTPAVIGLTVVAAGTSVPELAVSLIAALQGSADITMGNVVGSNIANLALIMGLTALVQAIPITGSTIKLEYPVMLLVTLLCLVLSLDGWIGRLDAFMFVGIYVAFTAYMIHLVRKEMSAKEDREFKEEVKELSPPARPKGWICTLLVFGGIGLLGLGAQCTVTGAVELAKLVGMSERVIGLTIIAVGTSLPEIVTSIVSSLRGRPDVAIGNLIGSNLFNILGILGISGLITPLSVAPGIIYSDNLWMLGVTILIWPFLHTGSRLNRWEGGLLLAIYVGYIAQLLRQTG